VVNDGTEDSAPDTVEITVVASATGLATLVEEMFDEGWINDPDIRDSLLDKINAATNKMDQGKTKPAENILNAFINHINAQTGKHISQEAAAILIADAEHIIANL
jgi:triphosphoribosyl-dephospho-CoA synthetase